MKRTIASNPTLVGILVVAFSFLALAIAPKLLNRKRFFFPVPSDSQRIEPPAFALDTPMKIVQGQATLRNLQIRSSKVSLRQILQQGNRAVLVNLWATWCPPCIEEFPSIEYLNRQLRGKDSTLPLLISISVDENERDIRKFYNTLNFEPSLVVLHDTDGEVSRAFGTVKFPETHLLSSNGQILHKWIGPQDWLSKEIFRKISNPN